MKASNIALRQGLVKLMAEVDECKHRWNATKTHLPDHFDALRKVAIVESDGLSTHVEGAKLAASEVKRLQTDYFYVLYALLQHVIEESKDFIL